MSARTTVLLWGRDNPFAQEITVALEAAGSMVLASVSGPVEIDALVLVTSPPALGTPFLDITDAQLSASLDQFLDLFESLRDDVPRLRDDGAVLVVSDRGHLGGWHGAHEMAFSGAVAGLLRSVALENASRRIRANLIAVELPDAKTPSDPSAVASLAAFLVSPAAVGVNGELILANGGRSLQIREARDRRAPAPT
jgi:NAD(P)-dependent dehydrogenase (short-subunit alcohol dehydrogenase family)